MSKKFNIDSLQGQDIKEIINLLKSGKIGIFPTDTIYGIHGSIFNKQTVEKIYKLKTKDGTKPMIALISSLEDLTRLDIKIDDSQKKILSNIWPGQVSIIFKYSNNKYKYLHRGYKSQAFRLPNSGFLLKILKLTGPLISTSANFHGETPAVNIKQAISNFGDNVDFYIDGGVLKSDPSTLIELKNNNISILRQGVAQIDRNLLEA